MKLARGAALLMTLAGLALPAVAHADDISGYVLAQNPAQPAMIDAYVTDNGGTINPQNVIFTLTAASPTATSSYTWKGQFNPATDIAYAAVPEDGSVPAGTYTVGVQVQGENGLVTHITALQNGDPALLTWNMQPSVLRYTIAAQENSATVSQTTSATYQRQGARVCSFVGTGHAQCQAKRVPTIRLAKGKQTIAGSLLTSSGLPEASQQLLIEQTLPHRQPAVIGHVATDSQGRFRYTARGPVRTLTVAYQGSASYGTVSAYVNVRTVVPVKLRTARRANPGAKLNLSGRIEVGNSGGLTVDILGRSMTRRQYAAYRKMSFWQRQDYFDNAKHPLTVLGSVTANGRGQYRASFTIPRRDHRRVWFFKARVDPPAGWPYVSGWSAPERVFVG